MATGVAILLRQKRNGMMRVFQTRWGGETIETTDGGCCASAQRQQSRSEPLKAKTTPG